MSKTKGELVAAAFRKAQISGITTQPTGDELAGAVAAAEAGKRVALVGAGATGFQIAPTIAEQVEHQEDFDWLRDIGVDYVQGYFVDRPVNLGSMTTGAYRTLNT